VIPPNFSKTEALKRMEELESLVNTYGGIVVIKTIQKRSIPDYKTYIGKGKVNELYGLGQEEGVKVIIVNNLLKPGQIYNLEKEFFDAGIKVWDRVDLILKIFEKHANSTEAKLQVELASIKHMGPRIFGMGDELSRQGGAMGMRAGQGESNIEMMKRHLRRQELKILEKLEHYETIRKGHRQRRRKKAFKTFSLVGYTNAGKSSILNALTNKGAYAADELFATLDSRVGKLYLPGKQDFKTGKYNHGSEILISDTIGFIQDLPPMLIKAFKSTLAETVDCDVLLHVIDISDPQIYMKINVVEEILEQIGLKDKKKIYIFNKIDLIDYKYFFQKDKRVFNDEISKSSGLIEAGDKALKSLGWEEEKQEDRPLIAHTPQDLKEKFSHYSPVFVSANEKINIDILLRKIAKS